MYAFFIHFFSRSVESEYTINRIRRDLNCVGLDEFHFQSTSTYPDKKWKDKSEEEIGYSDFVVFIYSSSNQNNANRFENVKFELDAAFEKKKVVFMVPLDPSDKEYESHLKNPQASFPFIDQLEVPSNDKKIDKDVIVTNLDKLVEYISSAKDNSTSSIPSNQKDIEDLVKTVEDKYGIQSRTGVSSLYNKIQVESVVRKKINESMVNQNHLNSDSIIVQYEAMFNSIENLDEKRLTNNTVYTTINTAMVALIAASLSIILTNIDNFVGAILTIAMFFVLPITGIMICVSWKRSSERYKKLRKGKFKTLEYIESYLPLNINKAEWEVLKSISYVTATDNEKLWSSMIKLHCATMIIGALILIISGLLIFNVV